MRTTQWGALSRVKKVRNTWYLFVLAITSVRLNIRVTEEVPHFGIQRTVHRDIFL